MGGADQPGDRVGVRSEGSPEAWPGGSDLRGEGRWPHEAGDGLADWHPWPRERCAKDRTGEGAGPPCAGNTGESVAGRAEDTVLQAFKAGGALAEALQKS